MRKSAPNKSSSKSASNLSALSKLKAAAEKRGGSRPLTARAVAELCGVELKTVHNWAAEGLITHFRTPGRHLRFQADDVIDFLENCGYKLSESETVGSALVVAKGSLKTKLKRALKGLPTEWADNPLPALVVAGRTQPDAVLVEPRLLAEVSANSFFSALSKALPKAKLFCLGGAGRVPLHSTRLNPTDLSELRAELGLSS